MSTKEKKSATTKTKDVSESKPAAPELLLELLAGKEKVALARPFLPNENEIEVILERDGSRKTYPLIEVCCILLKDDPNHLSTLQSSHDLMEIETLAGSKHLVRVAKDQHFPTGFYGSYLDLDNPYRSAFFTSLGVKSRRQLNFLGTILEEQGMVSRETLQEVIRDYNNIKKKRIGETIAQKHNLNQEKIEKSIRKMQKEGKIPHSARVGDILIASRLITQEQLEDAIAQQVTDKNKKIGALLVERKHINADQLLSALAIKFQLEFVNLDDMEPTNEALHAMPLALVTQMKILPISDKGDHLLVATSKPAEHAELGDILRFITNRRIKFVVAPSGQIADAIEKYYTRDEEKLEDLIGEMSEDAVAIDDDGTSDSSNVDETDSQIIKLVNKILISAYKKDASDIHLEPGTGGAPLAVRYRVDGLCNLTHEVPASYKKALLSRLKIMSNLDITERRRPQSGKIVTRYKDQKIEYRLETTPTVGGNEDAVLRVLAQSKPIPPDQMGFSARDYKIFETAISKPLGIILCVGPTGSGKTTTLHSALGYINKPDRKIWTAEDPVEITQKGLRQVQVNPKIGFTFQKALRSFLRSDPDVIMIGEMRDQETAKTAIEASLTGHLVLSTLHTNSAPETLVRLVEMGMDRVNFSEALSAVIAQRLVRILCKKCKKSFKPDKEYFEKLKVAYGTEWFEKHGMDTKRQAFKQRVGCKSCDQVGYRGRSAIFEMLESTDRIKKGIKEKASTEELKQVAMEHGMRTLRMDAVVKCFQGITDLDEILRVC